MPEKRKQDKISSGKWNVLDLFAGCGGFSLGFENAGGFNILAANELDATAAKTYQINFPRVEMVVGDLSQEDIKNKVLEHFSKDTPCDLIIGGPPDEAYLEYLKMVQRIKPKMFVMENVKGILTAKTPDDELMVDKIWQDFYDIGYRVAYENLNCAEYGVPQKRERVIFIGVRKEFNLSIYFPILTHIEQRFVSVKKAIDDLKDKANDERRSHIIPQHDEKTKEKISKVESGGSNSGKYYNYRLDPKKPSRKITTYNHPIHYEKNRLLTARECARIQSFPDDFLFEGSQTKIYKQIGNAVPPLFAKCIGETVKTMLEKINEEESNEDNSDDESIEIKKQEILL